MSIPGPGFPQQLLLLYFKLSDLLAVLRKRPPDREVSGAVVAPERLAAHREWIESDEALGERLTLRGDYTGADLSGQDLRQADLSQCDFRDATFAQANLQEADLTETTFWEADMRNADLTGVRGLYPSPCGTASPLGGANVTGATLPEETAKFGALDNVAELSKNAGKLFISLITADAFMQLIVAKTTDVQLLTNSGTTKIPVLDADIPTVTLFWLGPLVLLVLYVSFLLYLQRLWEIIAGLPALFPDGVPLTQKSYPWLLNDLVRSEFKFLKAQNRPLARTQELLFTFLAYTLVPLTLFPFWARYLCRHEWMVTGWQIGYAGVFLWTMITFLELARLTLRRLKRRKQGGYYSGWGVAASLAWSGLVVLLSLSVITWGIPRDRWQEDRRDLATYSLRRWVPRVLDELGYRPFANFEEAELSVKPDGWLNTDKDDIKKVRQPVHLKDADLRYANLHKAFLVNADLRGVNLFHADLRETDLRGSDCTSSARSIVRLGKANLEGAHLEESHFGGMAVYSRGPSDHPDWMYCVYINGADFRGATLSRAHLMGVHLEGAHFEGARLTGTDLRSAHLDDARLDRATLHSADMDGIRLDGAYLLGADLTFAYLPGSSLENAQLEGARFLHAIMDNTNLTGAELKGADLSNAQLLNAHLYGAHLDGAHLEGTEWGVRTNWPDGKTWPDSNFPKQHPEMKHVQFLPHRKSASRSSPIAPDARKGHPLR